MGFVILRKQNGDCNVQNKPGQTIRLFDRRVLPVLIAIACVYIGFLAFQQTISFFMQDAFSLTSSQAVKKTGIAVTMMAISMVVVQLVYIQIFRPRQIILLCGGVICTLTGFTILMLIPSQPVMAYAASALLGAGFGMLIPAIQSAVSLSVSEQEQSGVAGFLFGASAFGYVIGPAMGALLYSYSPRYLFSLGIASILIAALSAGRTVFRII